VAGNPPKERQGDVRIAVSLMLVTASVIMRKAAGHVLPEGHPLRTFELDLVDLLQGAERAYLAAQKVL
jgi:hypothetical protein